MDVQRPAATFVNCVYTM